MTHDMAAIQRRNRDEIEYAQHDIDQHQFVQQQAQRHKK